MKIEKRINLNSNIYYVMVDVEYKTNEHGFTKLCLKNYKDDYYDEGDLSILIEKIEKNYRYEIAKKYEENIAFMADILYIYDRIPFLSGIKEIYINKNDSMPNSISYISKEEIEKYINENKIEIKKQDKFRLCVEETWNI